MGKTVPKEILIQKYRELKQKEGKIPLAKEYYRFVGIHPRNLQAVYGDSPYSKLQIECGDDPNKLELELTPLALIMRQYGDLALELGKLPSGPNWRQKGLKPTIEGLTVAPHSIKWSEMPFRFREWALNEQVDGYSEVLNWIPSESIVEKKLSNLPDSSFEELIATIQRWSPARRRNSEESYKVELRMHLKSRGLYVGEEYGESDVDLLVEKKFAIEIKKAPNLSEYDRLFGQIARHLQHGEFVVALLMDVPRDDHYRSFLSLVDEYLNKDSRFVEVIKK